MLQAKAIPSGKDGERWILHLDGFTTCLHLRHDIDLRTLNQQLYFTRALVTSGARGVDKLDSVATAECLVLLHRSWRLSGKDRHERMGYAVLQGPAVRGLVSMFLSQNSTTLLIC